jgi:S-formylglutathione hydrolase FrmB
MRSPTLRRAAGMLAATAAAAATVVASSAAPAWAVDPPFAYADTAGMDVQGTPAMVDLDGSGTAYQPNPRLWDVTVVSPSIFVAGTNPAPPPEVGPVQIPIKTRIFLPAGYDDNRAAGYPVLYILHGGNGQYSDWSAPDMGNVTGVLNSTPVPIITVMVEGGKSGWFSNWSGQTDGHFRPLWETYHVNNVVGWVDANLNSVPNRSGRAIAGVSMGGLGAMSYAGRNSGVFSAVATFSGAVEMRHEPFQDTVSNSMWVFGATVGDQGLDKPGYRITTGEAPEAEETTRLNRIFGTASAPVAPETRPGWPAKNPVEQARAGRYAPYTKVAMYSGDSLNAWDGGEEDIVIMNNALHTALGGVSHRYCRGFGTHDWKYWRNDLADFVAYAYGTTPSTCTTNGLDTWWDPNDNWSLVP